MGECLARRGWPGRSNAQRLQHEETTENTDKQAPTWKVECPKDRFDSSRNKTLGKFNPSCQVVQQSRCLAHVLSHRPPLKMCSSANTLKPNGWQHPQATQKADQGAPTYAKTDFMQQAADGRKKQTTRQRASGLSGHNHGETLFGDGFVQVRCT